MKVTVKLNGVDLTAEGENQKEVFEQLAQMQEVFGNVTCPVTETGEPSSNVRFVVRDVEDPKNPKKSYRYYEMRCNDPPYARLSFGQHNEKNTLFPKRKGMDGNYLENQGWEVYKK